MTGVVPGEFGLVALLIKPAQTVSAWTASLRSLTVASTDFARQQDSGCGPLMCRGCYGTLRPAVWVEPPGMPHHPACRGQQASQSNLTPYGSSGSTQLLTNPCCGHSSATAAAPPGRNMQQNYVITAS